MMTKKMIAGWVIMMVISMSITSLLAQTCTETLNAVGEDCKGTGTILDQANCCADFNLIYAADPACLCGIFFAVHYLQPTADLESIFTRCPIPGSFQTLCLEP
ncbi:hypothetical protein RND81_13G049900 [Saponaria officinalis]|uniref:Bifunctional inhibitor/plant lipid transfer protein/seed storage helical domain-containing protein n=1 Tax=Saponaria officinalis TaxID=3572 RepID=A0AAW1GU70_SAPOF